MKKFFFVAAMAASLAGLAGCGGTDNVAACNKWKTAAACGSSTALSAISCDAYANTTCDISAFFDCLSTAYVCVDGQYDLTKLSGASACGAKSVCK